MRTIAREQTGQKSGDSLVFIRQSFDGRQTPFDW